MGKSMVSCRFSQQNQSIDIRFLFNFLQSITNAIGLSDAAHPFSSRLCTGGKTRQGDCNEVAQELLKLCVAKASSVKVGTRASKNEGFCCRLLCLSCSKYQYFIASFGLKCIQNK